MKNTEAAFHWIVGILERNNIPYKISGGFAARVYGVTRDLADIDIDVEDVRIEQIADVRPHITFGPAHYKDDAWDLRLMTLTYEGQDIDIAGVGAKIFNRKTNQWERRPGGLNDVEFKEVFGAIVPLESKTTLIAYKTILARDVDLEDVRQLRALYPFV